MRSFMMHNTHAANKTLQAVSSTPPYQSMLSSRSVRGEVRICQCLAARLTVSAVSTHPAVSTLQTAGSQSRIAIFSSENMIIVCKQVYCSVQQYSVQFTSCAAVGMTPHLPSQPRATPPCRHQRSAGGADYWLAGDGERR